MKLNTKEVLLSVAAARIVVFEVAMHAGEDGWVTQTIPFTTKVEAMRALRAEHRTDREFGRKPRRYRIMASKLDRGDVMVEYANCGDVRADREFWANWNKEGVRKKKRWEGRLRRKEARELAEDILSDQVAAAEAEAGWDANP